MADSDIKTYRGNCHCGAFVYEIDVPEIKTAFQCTCSHDTKKGHVFVPIQAPETRLRVVKGFQNDLATYSFASKTWKYRFCSACGSSLLAHKTGSNNELVMAINARTLQNFEFEDLDIKTIDGAAMGAPYKPLEYTGPEPSADNIPNAITYHASCHCNAVQLAFKTLPLDASFNQPIRVCNCSICHRNAYIWAYPQRDQVVITGKENLTHYAHGNKLFIKSFCKTCGVNVGNSIKVLTESEQEELPEGLREWYPVALGWNAEPVNLRLVDGLDLEELKMERVDGWNDQKPMYVNP